MAISMLKIRRPLGRLIFNMGIAIPGKTVFLIESPPSFLHDALPEQTLIYSYIDTIIATPLHAINLLWKWGQVYHHIN